MSSKFDENKFKKLKAQFKSAYAKIEPYENRRQLTKSESLKLSYRTEIVIAYNNLAHYLGSFFEVASEEGKYTLNGYIIPFREKLERCFKILNLSYKWLSISIYETIDDSKIKIEDFEEDYEEGNGSGINKEKETINTRAELTSDDSSDESNNTIFEESQTEKQSEVQAEVQADQVITIDETVQVNLPQNLTRKNAKMAQSIGEMIKLSSQTITSTFSGDPTTLQRFIKSIELADLLCHTHLA